MADATTVQGVLFERLLERPLHVRFDQPDASADGGAFLLKAADERLGLSAALVAVMRHPLLRGDGDRHMPNHAGRMVTYRDGAFEPVRNRFDIATDYLDPVREQEAALGIGVPYARLGLVTLAQVALVGIGGWL